MKVYLTRRYHFSASHRLHSEQLSAEENLATYGKCNNPHGHGHNYVLEVTVAGKVDGANGRVFDRDELDHVVRGRIVERYDLQNLNTLTEFADLVPTTENLCISVYDILQRGLPQAHLERVRVEETMMNSFEYAGGRELAHL